MMATLKRLLERYGLYCFLLPVFFALHNYMQYYGLVSGTITLEVLAVIEGIFLGCFLLLLLLTRHAGRSLQITALLGFIVLFYGVIKDFFKETIHLNFLARYTVLLPLLALLSVLLIIAILKKKEFRKLTFFQNLLLLLFIAADGISLLYSGGSSFLQKTLLVKNNIVIADSIPVPPARPDVYYLVFDSYPGTTFLQDYVQYDNSAFNTALHDRGFHVIAHPESNYNRTAFSISSTLNFEYLHSPNNNVSPEPKHYNQAMLSIEHAAVPAVFAHLGYTTCNLSVFDLAGHPALYRENFLVLPETRMLLYNTLPERIKRDILWHFTQHGEPSKKTIEESDDRFIRWNLNKKYFNDKAIDSLLKIPRLPATAPKFIYAHFYLPHPPFFYDKDGNPRNRNREQINADMEDKAAFTSYLEYTNKVILKLVDTILRSQRTPPVIIVQSDHGYRDLKQTEVNPHLYFQNYSAFYFPDKDYSSLYDTLSNINTFPLIFNKYFKTNIPIQKDSVVFNPYPG